MIEAKAIQRIRHAEIKAQKIAGVCEKESAKKLVLAEKSCTNRAETETQWAKNRSEKIVDHARKTALDEKSRRLLKCSKEIESMKKPCAPRKKKAASYILNEICGSSDA